MGPAGQQPLVTAVDSLALDGHRGEGATAAVQARLARRRLPTIGQDGLVQYIELDGDRLEADAAWVELGGNVLVTTDRNSGSAAEATPSTPGSAGRHSSTSRWASGSRKKLGKMTQDRHAYEVKQPFFPFVLAFDLLFVVSEIQHCMIGESLVSFPRTPKYVTLNGLEWLFYVKFCFLGGGRAYLQFFASIPKPNQLRRKLIKVDPKAVRVPAAPYLPLTKVNRAQLVLERPW